MKSFRYIVLSFCTFLAFLGFQNCSKPNTNVGTSQKATGSMEANANGVPYTGKVSKYVSVGKCEGGASGQDDELVATIEKTPGKDQYLYKNLCDGKTEEISSGDFFRTAYALDFLSFENGIFQLFDKPEIVTSSQLPSIICWLGEKDGATDSSGIHLSFNQSLDDVSFIITGEFSDSGLNKEGLLSVSRVANLDSGPEANWIFLEGGNFNFTVTDQKDSNNLFIATFEGVLETQPILYEFGCERSF
ncbi:MAG: hypothetical protein HRT44_12710 [Bdellovibrionales bacterium]|nr:hypothetical protein [Bdellovibrionales bacterium]NQZ20098.1 hypothetical protein [Bdellovibrionales bacterium]